jgi:hypothetical protein
MTSWLRIILALLIFVSSSAFADENSQEKFLPFWNIFTDVPSLYVSGAKASFSKDALPGWGVLLGSSALLYHYDPDILQDVQAKGRSWDLGNSVNYKSVLSIGQTTIYSAPRDTAGWLYFMGDGTIPILVAGSFMGVGYFRGRSRLYNTGVEMASALLSGALIDQVIKRATGRESPSAASEPRGAWRPFTGVKEYGKFTARYDAMPSGHIMSATVLFTVLEEEYSEYNYIFYPLEVVWLGVLGFGMINVGVHWASDYPLGIALGYVAGRAAVRIHHPERVNGETKTSSWHFFPGVHEDTNTPTINALYSW